MNALILMAVALGMPDFKIKPQRVYSPCKTCGNPAKGGHCFKCQMKEVIRPVFEPIETIMVEQDFVSFETPETD